MQTDRPDELSGIAIVAVGVVGAFAVATLVDASPLVAGVVLGAIASNVGLIRESFEPGIAFAATRLLRVGIVLLGLRLSVEEVRTLGIAGAIGVVVVLLLTFFGVQLIARKLGLSDGLGLLVATGYSICGASAIAAVAPLSSADEDETAYAIGLVTLFGTLSIFALPMVGRALGLSNETFGTWAGAGVHDVGQVTATASAYAEVALAAATLVKLTRVAMLAPVVFGVGVARRRRAATPIAGAASADVGDAVPRVPLVPLFVLGFLAAMALRATGWLSGDALATAQDFEKVFLTASMFGLGAGVRFSRLRHLGGRPLVLGALSWVLIAGGALVMAVVIS